MNSKIILDIAMRKHPDLVAPGGVVPMFLAWLEKNGIDTKKGFQPAGKNFASFDKPFLEHNIPRWKQEVKMKHRTIDPGNLYWDIGNEVIPDTKTCYERALLDPTVAHTAVEDAKGVVLLVRAAMKEKQRVARMLESGGKFTEAFGYVQAALHDQLVVDPSDPMGMARAIVQHVEKWQG
jgi:hypothetical protein